MPSAKKKASKKVVKKRAPKTEGIKCSMTVAHVAEQRWLEIHLLHYQEACADLEVDGQNLGARQKKLEAQAGIMQIVMAFCTGKIGDVDVSNGADIDRLPAEHLISLADSIIKFAEGEAKKSAASFAPLPKVVVSR